MKPMSRVACLPAAVLILLILVSPGSGQPDQNGSDPPLPEICGYQAGSLVLDYPYLAWVDTRSGPDNPSVILYTIPSGSEETIRAGPAPAGAGSPVMISHPALADGLLAWEENHAIVLYDIMAGKTKRLTGSFDSAANESTLGQDPAISGSRVVWSEQDYPLDGTWNRQIVSYDLRTGTTMHLAPADADQVHPDIDGDYVVWEEFREGPDRPILFLYNLTSGSGQEITSEGRPFNPRIDGTAVVWTEGGGGRSRILLYDIPSGVTRELVQDPLTIQYSPAVSGQNLIWLQSEPGWMNPGTSVRLTAYNQSTGEVRPFLPGNPDIADPRISGDMVVYGEILPMIAASPHGNAPPDHIRLRSHSLSGTPAGNNTRGLSDMQGASISSSCTGRNGAGTGPQKSASASGIAAMGFVVVTLALPHWRREPH